MIVCVSQNDCIARSQQRHAGYLLLMIGLQVLAGMVTFFSGKLKDFFAHYACDADEMWMSVALWRRCVLALAPPLQASGHPDGLGDGFGLG